MKKDKKDFANKTLLIWKMAIASAISWELAKLAGSNHPYLAPLSVILCLQTTIYKSIRFSFHRIAGTVVGVLMVSWFVSHLPMNGWSLGLLMLAGTLAAKWLKMDETAIHQVALTILLLFTFERKSGDYGFDRVVDTIIGAAVAVIVHMILFPPDFTKDAEIAIKKTSHKLSVLLGEMANWVDDEWGANKRTEMENRRKDLLDDLHTVKDSLNIASRSLKFNPLGKKHKEALSSHKTRLKLLENGFEYASAVIGTLSEWEKTGTLSPIDQTMLKTDLQVLKDFFKDAGSSDINQERREALIDLLQSTLAVPHGQNSEVYRNAFYLDTRRLLQRLK
ncbi:FUSC family protein [Neobacillus piezotolerans]|uniref:FUSC family protein n=1 Tax=Neobacillus piezotolerans TaxID=2259171 RepID=A0A3D8GU23_9BACI|nr:FUSC family protein [Neobacillus piezotolerans]RDU37721.1 FUSC family protein [Neobacillus piezotolerans]